MENQSRYTAKSVRTGLVSFLLVLLAMPVGHAAMALMEHFLTPVALHYAAFGMGFVGLVVTVWGVFVKGDTRQTLFGLLGGLLFWTGWVEFIFVYYANRCGVEPLRNAAGDIITRGEYLIMPSSFGFWAMFMLLYIFSAKTGCQFFEWLQRTLFRDGKVRVQPRPMAHHTAIVTFMELNLMMWSCYLLLLFCYDEAFLGDRHPVTIIVAIGCLVGSLLMMRKLLTLSAWGYAIRYAIATVIVFWSFVEIVGRWDWFTEIWTSPLEYKSELVALLIALLLPAVILLRSARKNKETKSEE